MLLLINASLAHNKLPYMRIMLAILVLRVLLIIFLKIILVFHALLILIGIPTFKNACLVYLHPFVHQIDLCIIQKPLDVNLVHLVPSIILHDKSVFLIASLVSFITNLAYNAKINALRNNFLIQQAIHVKIYVILHGCMIK